MSSHAQRKPLSWLKITLIVLAALLILAIGSLLIYNYIIFPAQHNIYNNISFL